MTTKPKGQFRDGVMAGVFISLLIALLVRWLYNYLK
jgi:hypothetical protein